jgi:putative PIG3 family NAD(P)H quinone oxidoreductase
MRAIVYDQPGDPGVLHIAEVPDPIPAPGEVLLCVHASALNRADLLQRRGFYPPPPGASDIIGMEASGVVEQITEGVEGWKVGDPACALLAGGGYAEKVAVPAPQLMPIPQGLDTVQAGAIPEVFLTAHDNMVTRGRLRPGDTVLIHGGAGGVGTAAIQIARRIGARVITTAGSPGRVRFCRALGADEAIDHREEDFVARVAEITGGRGADVILDIIGASYLERNLGALAVEGRLVIIGLQGGVHAEIDLNTMLAQRQSLIATTMRRRSPEDKGEVARRAVGDLWPGFADGSLRPVIDRILPLERAADAHRALEAGEATGKIVLAVNAAADA